MSLIFSVSEAIKGFKRAKLSAFASTSSIALSVIIIGILFIILFQLQKSLNLIKEKIDMEAFIDDSVPEDHINALVSIIQNYEEVGEVTYVSKEEAAEEFKEDFGEDILNLFDENPLPRSLRIKLKDEYFNRESFVNLESKLSEMKQVSDVNVVFDLIFKFFKYWYYFLVIAVLLAIIIIASSILLVSNTIKLSIHSRTRNIEIMKLVGATDSFIRRPFVIEGFFQGLIGGLFGIGFIFVMLKLVSFIIRIDIYMNLEFYAGSLLFALALGIGGSITSIRRTLK